MPRNSIALKAAAAAAAAAGRLAFYDFYSSSCSHVKGCRTEENIEHLGAVLNLHLHPVGPSKYICVYVCV